MYKVIFKSRENLEIKGYKSKNKYTKEEIVKEKRTRIIMIETDHKWQTWKI